MNTKSYDRITERIVALMEQGIVPWHKPWQVTTGLPRNLVTQRAYRGINTFLLITMGYESPNWLTFRQAIQLGGSVKKGEKSCPVVFWKSMEVTNQTSGEVEKIPFLRLYHVFNSAQCEGLKNVPATDVAAFAVTKPAEIVANMPQPPVIKHGMTDAFYSPTDDTVGMPEQKRFETVDSYHAALFHELVHSTGHEKRLKRQSIMERNGFGSDPYCKEELVAELGSAFLCGHSGIVERTIDNSAAYLKGWLTRLKSDGTFIVYAAAQAQKAADYILGRTFQENEVEA
ncbi:MAG: zincin-like metallopeptidase domain-containing protein [Candidatus Pacebacteria bacterium]|nr:zincin-like metallopeptidase domain-containing protein [Candidatus Paceibacterota bacterium]